jgi:hypothetical protein
LSLTNHFRVAEALGQAEAMTPDVNRPGFAGGSNS